MARDKALSYASNPELWLTSVSITLACIALVVIIGYNLSEKNRSFFTRFLGVLFFARFVFLHGYMTGMGHWDIMTSLPLHLCGISSLVIIYIMFKYNQSIYEYLVLLGIPSAVHSILTPQFINGWDGYYFPEFYLSHGAILLAPLYLSINYGYKLRMNSWISAFRNGLILAFFIALINITIGYIYGLTPNYLYLCEAPIADNPLLFTTEWPYYFFVLVIFMFIHIVVIYYIFKLLGKVENSK
ncbi:MAG: hypothetical protein CBD26_03315 [Candidatus Pelagibacter sp. TMED166]|nr:MAG: hypothetical protein CBD26_03315 [Candidatus Pelagibacter sp. TMED166]|tara:strand:- start:37378 stop:38103 length:726 start_codon:yes stop_codon:yes gene_type:complete